MIVGGMRKKREEEMDEGSRRLEENRQVERR
jgi:hypothetical protein